MLPDKLCAEFSIETVVLVGPTGFTLCDARMAILEAEPCASPIGANRNHAVHHVDAVLLSIAEVYISPCMSGCAG